MQRREFFKSAITAAATFASLQARAFAAPAERPLRVALIGSGWYGKSDLLHLAQVAPIDVVGLCDVDSRMATEAADLVARRLRIERRAPTYRDYRQLLAEQRPEIVLVATPDHWHALPMIEACKHGADVYVQKPISYDVVEGQAMVAAARKYGRTVQVGLQRRSAPHLLDARDRFLLTGKLGTIAHAEIHSYFGSRHDFLPITAPPEHLDWEMYVGPAPWRDYRPGIHPRSWRDCREFSNGQTGDLCVHFFDFIRYVLGLSWPRAIAASGGLLMRPPGSSVNTHDTQTAIFDFGHLQVIWNQRNWGANPDPDYPWGAALYGDKGTLRFGVLSYDFTPHGDGNPVHRDFLDEREKFPEDAERDETELFAASSTRRHLENFLAARRDGKRPVADIEEGHISTACCILANLSMHFGRSLQFDPVTGHIKNDDDATRRLARKYRAPWIHPTPENV